MGIKQTLQEISIPVYILVMLFSTSAWIDIYGVWTELPLLVSVLPEGWSLVSYLVILIQLAGLLPLCYSLFLRYYPHQVKEWPAIYLVIIVGALSCLMLVFLWDFTANIGGTERSVGLFLFVFTLAIVDCTSTVVYLPYMDHFKPQYITAKYTGEGLGSLITGSLGLIQGSTGDATCTNVTHTVYNETSNENITSWKIVPQYKEPRFSIEVYFCILCGIMITSGIAFSCLHFMPFVKKHHVKKTKILDDALLDAKNGNYNKDSDRIYNPGKKSNKKAEDNSNVELELSTAGKEGKLRGCVYLYLMLLLTLMASLQYGVVPAIQSYACLPYGNMVYAYGVRFTTIAIPIAYFLILFTPQGGVKTVTVFTVLGTLFSAYQVFLAALSPTPPLQDHVIGSILAVTSGVLQAVLFSFSRVYIVFIVQRHAGRIALVTCGTFTIIGATTGAVVAFVCVNVLKVFESIPVCAV